MPVQEPYTERLFWDKVKARSGWPAADEDAVRKLADEWSWASRLFATASDLPVADLRGGWPDGTGESYAQSVELMIDRSSRVEVGALQQRGDLLTYAEIVENTKQAIRTYVHRRSLTYEGLYNEGQADGFVTQTAVEVNRLLDQAAEQAGGIRTGVAVDYPAGGGGYAEFEDVQQFMYGELVNNPKSPEAMRIRELMSHGTNGDATIALAMWIEKVAPLADWDHKPDIAAMTVGVNNTTPIPGTSGGIRYDFWSNLHFGYVGLDVGIDETTLRQGADAADLWDRQEVDKADDLAIQIGAELREKYTPEQLRPEHIEAAIKEHYAELVEVGGIIPGPRYLALALSIAVDNT
ncbi:polymorphic toxin type 44 domain-containing protein [Actinoplanes sp. NBRC 103695]|uniref:WXG100-like domain-containing protein n=1 Tax=Actinoplanes sp. NBRC 103695 TaxID=3032202 RepID=UPI00249FAD6B|nr:polymorphic toxin type 44 domain-containing protein [Actinoplanes sp. NBRC 103695]GLZ00091.1 hypothetical protein Acsp02_73430 [Actinoplanes sp. NBRC 103695]